jgi:hypothetical protein
MAKALINGENLLNSNLNASRSPLLAIFSRRSDQTVVESFTIRSFPVEFKVCSVTVVNILL